jgi:hypothetical protein
VDIATWFDQTQPTLPAAGMIVTQLLDVLGSWDGHFLGPIFGYVAGGGPGGTWPGLAWGDGGGAAMAGIVLVPLFVAETLVLTGFAAMRARRQQRRDRPARRRRNALPTTGVECRRGTC